MKLLIAWQQTASMAGSVPDRHNPAAGLGPDRIKKGAIQYAALSAAKNLLDELAPTHLTVPSGSRIPIDYSGDVPVLAVRLQEMFGLVKRRRWPADASRC